MMADMSKTRSSTPIVINTWGFTAAAQKAWDALTQNRSALDAVEEGCATCEELQCDHTVGWGGSPDETGETTLDAMIMDGRSHDVGAVSAMRRIKNAISVARKVLENTEHTMLAGEFATNFAVEMGFKEESLASNWSKENWIQWKQGRCQPNYWRNVEPNPRNFCGPYRAVPKELYSRPSSKSNLINRENHDTIGMVAIDNNGNLAAGTSTNGKNHKIPGRVGDSPIPGSGAYADQDWGGAAATGDGDIMMRFLPSYQAVENLRQGMSPDKAAEDAIKRIVNKYPTAQAAIVVTNIYGQYGASCSNMENFPFSVCNPSLGNVTVESVPCIQS